MLTEEDFGLFVKFRVRAFGEKVREIALDPSYDELGFEEKVKLALDAEVEARDARKVQKLNREAGFKDPSACVEDIVYLPERKLSRDRVARWASCGWVEDDEVMVIVSKTGCGKSYLCQALGNAACRRFFGVRYMRLSDMFDALAAAKAKGPLAYRELMFDLKTVKLLILDDFLTVPIGSPQSVELFEVVEAREGRRATLVCSQLEPQDWYLRITGEVVADSILSRIASVGRYYELEGPNMREYFRDLKARKA